MRLFNIILHELVGEAYEFGGANCWIEMGTRKYSKMTADSKPASKKTK
jgi:hypothetical protein